MNLIIQYCLFLKTVNIYVSYLRFGKLIYFLLIYLFTFYLLAFYLFYLFFYKKIFNIYEKKKLKFLFGVRKFF